MSCFFCSKKNVDMIIRKYFPKPERQDEYGTSVISIQFTKDNSHTLSIKNRYNHAVENPDATFSNNLDNIIEGLTSSFAQYYGMKQKHINEFILSGYVRAKDGKYYKYNYEMNNIYYCPNNIIIDNFEVKRLLSDKTMLIDCFMLNLELKTIELYDKKLGDSFVENIKKINKIEVKKFEDSKKIIISCEKENKMQSIVIDKDNQITGYENNNLEEIGDAFLEHSKNVKNLKLPQVRIVGNNFLSNNEELKTIKMPELQKVGNHFLYYNQKLENIETPKLELVGDNFLCLSKKIKDLQLPLLKYVGYNFLRKNQELRSLKLPELYVTGHKFIEENEKIRNIDLPNLKRVGHDFLFSNNCVKELYFPNLDHVGDNFFLSNKTVKSASFPLLHQAGSDFMRQNRILKNFSAPKLTKAGDGFLELNESLEMFGAANLEHSMKDHILKEIVERKRWCK